MKFVDVPVADAVGAILAHGHRLPDGGMLKKGHVLTTDDVRALAEPEVSVAVLEAGDLDENAAATRVASVVTGPNVTIAPAATGRANMFARARGLLLVDHARLDALNEVDEAITLATLPPYAVVDAGAMVATVKIIPFAVPSALVDRAATGPLLRVAPFTAKHAGLVMTTLPGVRAQVLDRAAASQRQRMIEVGGALVRELRVAHDASAIAAALRSLLDESLDLLMVLGASAIVDRKDVVPAAIALAGGEVDHLGMPVDPGNLLLLGHLGATPVIGVPGCARSLKPSGFDWVLQRLAADVPVSRADIVKMGAGGLLAEVEARPSLRRTAAPQRIAAVVLAAGMSRRMGTNKLLAEVDGVPIVVRAVDALLASRAQEVVVVVGHEAHRIRATLAGRAVRFVENPLYEEGLGASLRAGITALEDVDGALIALGDMPWIRTEHADALIAAFDPTSEHSICVPIHAGKRGHPVLWSARHFEEMRALGGDIGARTLLEKHAAAVQPVQVQDAAVHFDVDTPEMLTKRPE
jgi:molybdenum cofactor cytidylyltransferase